MNYNTYTPQPALSAIVKCYWTLEVHAEAAGQKQLILPDGCVDMCFILGDDIKRFTDENNFIIQPRQMLLGQITKPFYIEPAGYVNTFAARFYPYGFTPFIQLPLSELANSETPLHILFGNETAAQLSNDISNANNSSDRIKIIETFLLNRLCSAETIDKLVRTTVDTMFLTRGSQPVHKLLQNHLPRRRQIERNFKKQIGISPKQLSKVIRLQTSLQMLLNQTTETFTGIACENAYYDQAHFIKDFKEFTGITPKEFLSNDTMALSALFYKKD